MMTAAALFLLQAGALSAPPAPPAQGEVRYTVGWADSWSRIGGYLNDPRAIDALAVRNHLRPHQMLTGGQVISIPLSWLKSVPVQARIVAFRGPVRVQGASRARIGGMLGEGARIATGPGASITLRLPDGSIVALPSQSAIRIERLRSILLNDVYDRRFVLESGRSQYEVTPDHREGSRFNIKTPVSVAAVRGTIFRVSLPQSGGANTETVRGDVGVAGRTGEIDVPQGFGIHSDLHSTGRPIRLLPAPRLVSIGPSPLGPETLLLAPVPGARSYHVQVATDKAFTQLLGETRAPSPIIPLNPTAIGVYYLRATGVDANGLEGLPNLITYHHDEAQGGDAPQG